MTGLNAKHKESNSLEFYSKLKKSHTFLERGFEKFITKGISLIAESDIYLIDVDGLATSEMNILYRKHTLLIFNLQNVFYFNFCIICNSN